MKSFFLGILTSISAGVIIIIIGKYFKISFLRKLSGLNFFGHGIDTYFDSQKYAEKDLFNNFNSSSTIKIFACRGHSLTQPEYKIYKFLKDSDKTEVRILLADPKTKENPNHEIEKRVNEVPNKNFDVYITEINNVLDTLSNMKNVNPVLDFRVHNEPIIFRFFLFDTYLFISFFQSNQPASKTRVFKIKSDSILYNSFSKYFNRVWDKSESYTKE